jgi:hypothetical protein
MSRRVLYEMLVTNKSKGALGYEAKFNLKWIPDLKNTTTPLGDPVPGAAQKSGAFRSAGVERTALLTLLFTAAVVGLSTWGTVRTVSRLGWTNGATLDWESLSAPVRTFDWEKTVGPIRKLVRDLT